MDVVRPVAAAASAVVRVPLELPPHGPNLGEGTNLRRVARAEPRGGHEPATGRRAEPRAGHHKDGTWCEVRKRQMD
jgi:hypothetical protein